MKHVIIEIYSLLTPPQLVKNNNEYIPWIAAQFDYTPLVAAVAIFTSLKGDVFQAENIAISHLASRIETSNFNFNKIEPGAFSKTGYINNDDSLGLKMMIAAYDTTEAMKLEYWVHDTIEK